MPLPQRDLDLQFGVGVAAHVDAVDLHGAGGEDDLPAGPRQLVGAAAATWRRREGRRHLLDGADEPRQGRRHGRDAGVGRARRFGEGALGVVGVARRAEAEGAGVDLAHVLDVLGEAGRPAHADDEDARRQRVERAGVADARAPAEPPPGEIDGLARGDAERLVEDQ